MNDRDQHNKDPIEVFSRIRTVKCNGTHGFYSVCSPVYTQADFDSSMSVTVDYLLWPQGYTVSRGTFVVISGIYGKDKGYQASSARFATPSEIEHHKQQAQLISKE